VEELTHGFQFFPRLPSPTDLTGGFYRSDRCKVVLDFLGDFDVSYFLGF
jgi:hypothetical protein